MEEKTFKGVRIGVDCVENDPVDVNCGGPIYLGYDFIVKADEKEEMKKFIIETIKAFGLPLKKLTESSEFDYGIEHLWTKEKIVAEIPKFSSLILGEANRRRR